MRPRHVLFVFLMVVSALALLPVLFGVDASQCTWKRDLTSKGEAAARAPKDGPFGLSVKTGDGEITQALRTALEERLRAAGYTNLVDNPVTRPRADVALEEAQMRWLPFYASVKARVRGVLTGPGRGAQARGLDTSATVEGSCLGLVAPATWRAALVEQLADGVAQGILPKE